MMLICKMLVLHIKSVSPLNARYYRGNLGGDIHLSDGD